MTDEQSTKRDLWETPTFDTLELNKTLGFKGIQLDEASGEGGTLFGGRDGSS